jgi:hypothetical protein
VKVLSDEDPPAETPPGHSDALHASACDQLGGAGAAAKPQSGLKIT